MPVVSVWSLSLSPLKMCSIYSGLVSSFHVLLFVSGAKGGYLCLNTTNHGREVDLIHKVNIKPLCIAWKLKTVIGRHWVKSAGD